MRSTRNSAINVLADVLVHALPISRQYTGPEDHQTARKFRPETLGTFPTFNLPPGAAVLHIVYTDLNRSTTTNPTIRNLRVSEGRIQVCNGVLCGEIIRI